MRKIADLLATVGEYTTSDGPVKRRARVGELFRDERTGAMSLRIDTVPVSPHWSGWLAVDPVRDDGTRSTP